MQERRPRLLVTGTMSRADIVEMFRPVADAADLTFVEYERDWGQGIDPRVYDSVGDLTTWEESSSADALLHRVRPDRVVLLFTSSLNQVALRAAARDHGIEAVHVEHGYRLPVADAPPARTLAHRPEGKRLGGWRTHAFFARSLSRRSRRDAAALVRYGASVSRAGATPEVLRAFADLRRPDRYISYSRECFEYHRDVDRVPEAVAARTTFTGVPQFDDFRVAEEAPDTHAALLVDHQFHNSGLFGWTEAFRDQWVTRISETVLNAGFEPLHVKLHPGDRSGAWDPHRSRRQISIVDRPELVELSRTVAVVLGTFSTMQMPFAALPHVAMFSLEIHPEPGWFPSRRFVEAGVAEPVRTYSELAALLRETETIRVRQQSAKPAFTERFLARLDGHATERMASALVEP